MPWTPSDGETAAWSLWLRLHFPDWGIFYDPWLAVWVAVQGPALVIASTPVKLAARLTAFGQSGGVDFRRP